MPDALFWSFWLKNALIIWVYVSVWFLIRLVFGRERVGLASFGLGTVVSIWTTLYWLQNLSWAAWIVVMLVSLSGVWQASLVFKSVSIRTVQKEKDVYWYIREYGKFLNRGLFILVISIPAIQAILGYATLTGLFYVGMVVWFMGFGLASIGRIYYLGEILQWLGICLIAFTTADSAWVIISPILLLVVFSSKYSEKLTGENFIKN